MDTEPLQEVRSLFNGVFVSSNVLLASIVLCSWHSIVSRCQGKVFPKPRSPKRSGAPNIGWKGAFRSWWHEPYVASAAQHHFDIPIFLKTMIRYVHFWFLFVCSFLIANKLTPATGSCQVVAGTSGHFGTPRGLSWCGAQEGLGERLPRPGRQAQLRPVGGHGLCIEDVNGVWWLWKSILTYMVSGWSIYDYNWMNVNEYNV